MNKCVIKCLENMIIKSSRAVLLGDFNCKNVNWEKMEIYGNTDKWSEAMMQLVMENAMEQWVEKCTRFRGSEEPSKLDLVFTKKPDTRPNIYYQSPMGKSDHVVMEITFQDEKKSLIKEEHRKGRLNYVKANYEELKNFF